MNKEIRATPTMGSYLVWFLLAPIGGLVFTSVPTGLIVGPDRFEEVLPSILPLIPVVGIIILIGGLSATYFNSFYGLKNGVLTIRRPPFSTEIRLADVHSAVAGLPEETRAMVTVNKYNPSSKGRRAYKATIAARADSLYLRLASGDRFILYVAPGYVQCAAALIEMVREQLGTRLVFDHDYSAAEKKSLVSPHYNRLKPGPTELRSA